MRTRGEPVDAAAPRRRSRGLLVTVLGLVLLAVAVVLFRRRPRQTGPARPAAAAPHLPTPVRPSPDPSTPLAAVQPTDVQSDLPPSDVLTAADVLPARAAGAAEADLPPTPAPSVQPGRALLAVSGIGQRSAAALAAAGIGDLVTLAASDPSTLAHALATAGLRRSPTLTAWPAQARRLLED